MSEIANYQVFPKHVGHWEGTVRFLDAQLQETKHYKINQEFAAVAGKWVITNTYGFPDGTSLTHSFDVIPTGNGQVEVHSTEARFNETRMKAGEYGEDTVIFQVINSTTGHIQESETITLIQENRAELPQKRVRTAQLFQPDGGFKGLLVIEERRIS